MMKKVLFGAAALLAVAPVAAHAQTSGNISLSYSSMDDDNNPDKDGSLNLDGAVVTPLSGNWVVQFDGGVSSLYEDGYSYGYGHATTHAAYRTDNYAIGGFAGLLQEYYTAHYQLGIEGQWYGSNFTLSGAAAFDDVAQCDSCSDTSTKTFDVAGDFFVMPNWSIGGTVGYWDSDWYGNDSAWTYGLNTEYQFNGSPISIFGGYKHADIDYGSSDNSEDVFNIGLRFNFETANLAERSKTGASLIGGQSATEFYALDH